MVPLLILQEIEAQIKRQLNLFWTYRDPPLCPILISSIFIDIKDSSIIFHTGCLAKHDSLQTTPVSSDPIRVQIRLIQSGSRYVLADDSGPLEIATAVIIYILSIYLSHHSIRDESCYHWSTGNGNMYVLLLKQGCT